VAGVASSPTSKLPANYAPRHPRLDDPIVRIEEVPRRWSSLNRDQEGASLMSKRFETRSMKLLSTGSAQEPKKGVKQWIIPGL
jgi:hypothetical protein